jgi:hypothetical protein
LSFPFFEPFNAFAQNLTQRKVRRIDYWYLGAATIDIGMLFAVAERKLFAHGE